MRRNRGKEDIWNLELFSLHFLVKSYRTVKPQGLVGIVESYPSIFLRRKIGLKEVK